MNKNITLVFVVLFSLSMISALSITNVGSTPEETCLKERYTILNSFYFPDGDYEQLYPGISPVNTFRVVMDKYFGTDLGLLEDKTYYSGWTNLYDFVDVTDRVETCTWSEE